MTLLLFVPQPMCKRMGCLCKRKITSRHFYSFMMLLISPWSHLSLMIMLMTVFRFYSKHSSVFFQVLQHVASAARSLFIFTINIFYPPQIGKFDTDTKEIVYWNEENCWPSEPVFVPRPNGESEDDGKSSVVALVVCAKICRFAVRLKCNKKIFKKYMHSVNNLTDSSPLQLMSNGDELRSQIKVLSFYVQVWSYRLLSTPTRARSVTLWFSTAERSKKWLARTSTLGCRRTCTDFSSRKWISPSRALSLHENCATGIYLKRLGQATLAKKKKFLGFFFIWRNILIYGFCCLSVPKLFCCVVLSPFCLSK